MVKLLSCNLPDEQMEKLEAAAKRSGKTKTDMVQLILDGYFGGQQQYREELLREVVKTMSFCRRIADGLYGEEKSDELKALAERDMEEHLKQRRKA